MPVESVADLMGDDAVDIGFRYVLVKHEGTDGVRLVKRMEETNLARRVAN